MKIITRLKLNTWLSLGLLVLMLISVVWSLEAEYRANRNLALLRQIEGAAYDRVILRDDWILYREERAKMQWYDKTEILRKLLETASQRFKSKETRELLQETINNFNATHSLLAIVLEKHQRKEHAVKEQFAFTEHELRVISQVFLKAHFLNDNIDRLREIFLRQAATARSILFIVIIFFVASCIITIATNSIFLNRIVATSVTALSNGIKFIGNGNLDYQIPVRGNDELAYLARGMNEMAGRLKQSYTSVENMQHEIIQRQLLQEELDRNNRVLLVINHINQAIVRSSEQNKLFTDVCRITVEYGKFRLAWIGLTDEQKHLVIPVCWNGVEEGYLNKIKIISPCDIPEGRGPTGRAIREGKTLLLQ